MLFASSNGCLLDADWATLVNETRDRDLLHRESQGTETRGDESKGAKAATSPLTTTQDSPKIPGYGNGTTDWVAADSYSPSGRGTVTKAGRNEVYVVD